MSSSPQTIGVRQPMPGVVYAPLNELGSYIHAGALTHESLVDALRGTFTRHADRIAIDGPLGALTYRELDVASERLGAALLRLGCKPLDRVVFQLPNSQEFVLLWVACLKASLIPVCTLAAHREHEIGYLAQHAEAVVHAVPGNDPKFDAVALAKAMQAKVTSLKHILQVGGAAQAGALQLQDLIESVDADTARGELAAIKIDPFQVAVFQLSGGTTGVPKIIPRFHNEYLAMMRGVASFNRYTENDTVFIPLPMAHNLNMGCFFGPFLVTGGRVLVVPDLQPETLMGTMQEFKPTWMVLGPLAARLEGAIAAGVLDFSHVKGIVGTKGGGLIGRKLKAPGLNIFGMTEGVIMFTRPDEDPEQVLDQCVGRPISPLDQIKILHPGTETEVPDGMDGEPAFKGPYTIHGYYRAEDRNLEAFTSDGFYRSGDLMRKVVIDGTVYFEFRGRIKEVVDRGGEKINCEEVEGLLADHPSVVTVAAVGVPDPTYGERLCACVIARPGQETPSVELFARYFAQRGVAKFKWPERVEVMTELPVTASGKLSKVILKKQMADRVMAERNQ